MTSSQEFSMSKFTTTQNREKAVMDTIEALRRERDEWQRFYGVAFQDSNAFREQLAAMTQERDDYANGIAMGMNREHALQERLAASQACAQQLREALESCRSSVKFDLMKYERMSIGYSKLGAEGEAVRKASEWEANRLHKLIDTIDTLTAIPHDDTALKQWGAKLLRNAATKVSILDSDNLRRMADELEQGK